MLLALYIGWRIVRPFTTSTRMLSAITAFWLICAGAFYAAAVWLFTQPMQMRGMGM
jgi:hypothetical protein